MPPNSKRSASPSEIRPLAEGRANVVGRIDNGAGPSFAFNSHMDTVPAGGGWSSDPFRLTERDGKLFGRGACDAKGPVVAMVEAGRLLASQRGSWRGTLVLMFVADEEINGGGSRALAKQQPKPDWIVIGEPTNNAVFAAHKGCLRPLIRAKGKAAHSGRPELGVNAILAASRLMALIDARDRELRAPDPSSRGPRQPVGHAHRGRDRGQRHPGELRNGARPAAPAGRDARRRARTICRLC